MKIEYLAGTINLSCEDGCRWLAFGTIKETLDLWRKPDSYTLLCDDAQMIVDSYLDN